MLTNDITVIIATYERKANFRRALNSVINQTYQNFELVVVDDGSIDEYAGKMLEESQLNYKYIKNSSNKGIAATRNIGIIESTSPIICFLDDDDEYFPDFLKNIILTLQDTPEEVVMAWSNAKINIYKDDQSTPFMTKNRIFECRKYADYMDLLSIGTGYGVALKRRCFEKIGKFDTSFKVTEDTEFFIRLMNADLKCVINPNIDIQINHSAYVRQTSIENDNLRIIETNMIMNKYYDFFESNQIIKLEMQNYVSLLMSRNNGLSGKELMSPQFIASGNLIF